jgi:PAS domain S-box-containing protein
MVCAMSPDGVVLVGRDGRVLWCNPAMESLTGGSAEGRDRLLGVIAEAASSVGTTVAHLPTERGLVERVITTVELEGDVRVASFPIDGPAGHDGTEDEHTQRLEAMLRHTDDLITLVAADGTVQASNAAAGRLTGLGGSEINGRTAMDFVHPDDVEAASAAMAGVLDTPGATARTTARMRFADGEWHHVDASVTNLLDDPAVASLVVSMHDVTPRLVAEQRVARSEAMLRSLVENLTDVIVVLDERFEVVWATPGIEAIIDAPASTNVGRSAFNDVHPDDLGLVTETLTRLATAPLGEQARIDLRLEARPGSGNWRWIEATVVNRLTDPDLAGLVVTLRDVTDARAAARDLQVAFDRLRELDTLKEQFLASVSHEMRTPMAVIIGFADLLARGDEIAESVHSEAIDRIRSSAAEMRAMVENLLDFSALEAGKLSVARKPVPVRRAVDAALTAVSALLDDHPIVLDVPDGLRVLADQDGLDRVLRNLLVNAARYSERGRTITIAVRPGEDMVAIEVIDEGIGIAVEQQDLVFERLYRGPGAAFVSRGTGVGLTLVKRYVELMGGTVTVRSVLGEGSTFTMRLPAVA